MSGGGTQCEDTQRNLISTLDPGHSGPEVHGSGENGGL